MSTTLFLQSEIKEPYNFYETMLMENPVYWDDEKKHWAIYSYEDCKVTLSSASAHVPPVGKDRHLQLNRCAAMMAGQFARLSDGPPHEIARHTAMLLFNKMKTVEISHIARQLMVKEKNGTVIDWVDKIGKKLPALFVLKCFGFDGHDCDRIMGKIEHLAVLLAMLISPDSTWGDMNLVNEAANEIYPVVENHLLNSGMYDAVIKTLAGKYKSEDIVSMCTTNLIGLSIAQGYDGNRGLLSNSLLNVFAHNGSGGIAGKEILSKFVIEGLRFDPPVHNTRRVAAEIIDLNGTRINKGDSMLLVLAAANRDHKKFIRPNIFDIDRKNNPEHLTFGYGVHACLANEFAINLTVDTLSYFFDRYKKMEILNRDISYEPRFNVRLPKSILVSLS
jgi:cytochrome P450